MSASLTGPTITVPTDAAATRQQRRVRGVDVARAVALFAMMGTHLLREYDDGGRSTPFFWLASGRASALFAVLAGVGLALASGATEPRVRPWRATVARVGVRALLIAVVGLSLVALDPPIAVILTNYGLVFLLALPLLGLRPRPLLLLAGIWAILLPCLSFWWRTGLAAGPGPQLGFSDLAHPASLLNRLALTGYYPVLTWLAYLMVGLAIGRMPLRRPDVARWLVLGGAGLAAVTWLLSWALMSTIGWRSIVQAGPPLLGGAPLGARWTELDPLSGTTPTTTPWWLTAVTPHSGTPFDVLHTIGTSALVLGLALMVWSAVERAGQGTVPRPLVTVLHGLMRGLLGAFACVGSMSLTLYTAHVVVTDALQRNVATEAAAVGHVGSLEFLAQVAAALLLATLWRRSYSRGPLEQLVHAVSFAAAHAVTRSRAPDGTS